MIDHTCTLTLSELKERFAHEMSLKDAALRSCEERDSNHERMEVQYLATILRLEDEAAAGHLNCVHRHRLEAVQKESDHYKAEAVSAWDGMRQAKNRAESAEAEVNALREDVKTLKPRIADLEGVPRDYKEAKGEQK